MRNISFTEKEIYHIYNRGVEKRNIFLDEEDRFRFVHNLFEFNDEAPAANIYYKENILTNKNQSYETKSRKIEIETKRRKLIVDILIFVLMPNHFHLLLRQRQGEGIAQFMHKLGIGYTMYFNKKYERVGSLFQGTYKAVLARRDAHLLYLPYYIHLNSLDLKFPEWRTGEIKNYKEAMNFLENYRWSSYLDYIGKKNFPSVTQRKFLTEFLGGPKKYKEETGKWLKERKLEEIEDLILE